jgi:hypothetical protein
MADKVVRHAEHDSDERPEVDGGLHRNRCETPISPSRSTPG